ncbi:MAG TPA: acylphosphatase [Bdellovibrionota bacterium]|nr:acylphosphatase [Bdellovibrionota bacterium]
MVKRFRAIVSGRVQGVFYRATARDQAMDLGLKGFVRNLPDGCVELEAEGEEEALESLLRWSQHGPPSARVEKVTVEWLSPSRTGGGFQVTD